MLFDVHLDVQFDNSKTELIIYENSKFRKGSMCFILLYNSQVPLIDQSKLKHLYTFIKYITDCHN